MEAAKKYLIMQRFLLPVDHYSNTRQAQSVLRVRFRNLEYQLASSVPLSFGFMSLMLV